MPKLLRIFYKPIFPTGARVTFLSRDKIVTPGVLLQHANFSFTLALVFLGVIFIGELIHKKFADIKARRADSSARKTGRGSHLPKELLKHPITDKTKWGDYYNANDDRTDKSQQQIIWY